MQQQHKLFRILELHRKKSAIMKQLFLIFLTPGTQLGQLCIRPFECTGFIDQGPRPCPVVHVQTEENPVFTHLLQESISPRYCMFKSKDKVLLVTLLCRHLDFKVLVKVDNQQH